ncbi:MAG: long-chain-fatty-acid--CoA ligase [Rhodocyclaceae bacterium]|nr:long-chain-fatty-acid--CoA ligase [Rhodocyclaceae bacterium]
MFQSVPEIIRKWGQARHDRLAIAAPARNWTYADVANESNRVAQGLLSLGIGAGDRVGALTRHTAQCLVLLMAANKIGAVFTPMNWRLAPAELEYVINHSESRLLMVDAAFLPALGTIALPRVERILGTEPATETPLSAWAAAFEAIDPGHVPAPSDTALQLYSSGTTGKPKGVELSHANVLFQCNAIAEYFGYRKGAPTVLLDALPTFHVSGIVNTVTILHEAATVVAHPEFVPQEILESIQHHGVTNAFMVPTMMRMLGQAVVERQATLPSLRAIGYGGSPVSETVLKEVRDALKCGLIQVFGMTELAGMATCLDAADHDRPALLRSAGKPLQGVSLRIADLKDGHVCGNGEVGEIQVRSGSVMKGYFRNPQASAETLIDVPGEGRWLRTGDVGYIADGYLYLSDRIKELVISGGENIYPAEVENVIASHPAVADVAIIGVPDPTWGEAVKACVVLKPGAAAEADEIIAFARARIAHYKCPKSVDFVAALPRNPSGKLLKRVLREPYWADQSRAIA